MAEAYGRALGEERAEVASAGVMAAGIHPLTLRVLEEDGLDISTQTSKKISDLSVAEFDTVITLCGHARDVCPPLPKHVGVEHWPIQDPSQLLGNESDRAQNFRNTRDEIKSRVEALLKREISA